MIRTAIAAAALVAVTTPGFAQSNEETIERALMAAPNRAKEARRRRGLGCRREPRRAEGELERNGLLRPLRQPRHPCIRGPVHRRRQSRRVEQTLKAYAEGGSRQDGEKLLDAMEENGTRIAPVFGSVWHTMNGDSPEAAGTHITIAVPGATGESLGLSEEGNATRLWIMDAGTSTAHLMVPGR